MSKVVIIPQVGESRTCTALRAIHLARETGMRVTYVRRADAVRSYRTSPTGGRAA